MIDRIQSQWTKVLTSLATSPHYWSLTPELLALKKSLIPVIEKHASGDILDLGAGRLTYKQLLVPHAATYRSLDKYSEDPGLDYRCGGEAVPVPNSTFDVVFCSQVLEHVEAPAKILGEINRILKPGGRVILSVPHIGFLHDEPHDYWRFTEHGIRRLLADNNFDVAAVVPICGLFSYLSSLIFQVGASLLSLIPGFLRVWLPVSRLLAGLINRLDSWIPGNRHLFPADYVAVGLRK